MFVCTFAILKFLSVLFLVIDCNPSFLLLYLLYFNLIKPLPVFFIQWCAYKVLYLSFFSRDEGSERVIKTFPIVVLKIDLKLLFFIFKKLKFLLLRGMREQKASFIFTSLHTSSHDIGFLGILG
jgi:hypothetical protein